MVIPIRWVGPRFRPPPSPPLCHGLSQGHITHGDSWSRHSHKALCRYGVLTYHAKAKLMKTRLRWLVMCVHSFTLLLLVALSVEAFQIPDPNCAQKSVTNP